MIVSITGTRHGMAEPQKVSLRLLLETTCAPTGFLHGDCKGADDESATIADSLQPRPRIIAHPGPDGEWRAHNPHSDETLPEKNHFARNRDLVALCDVLLVLPRRMEIETRGGTAYTADFAVKTGKRSIVIWPDGSILVR